VDRAAVTALTLAAALAAVLPSSARAAIGVGVGTVPLTAAGPVVAGRTYHLRPSFYVANTGDRRTTYSFRVERLSHGNGATLDPSWVSFSPRTRTLAPGRHASITVSVRVPRTAGAGAYVSDIVATGSEPLRNSGAAVAVGAAAATPLEVDVNGRRGALAAALDWPWPGWGDGVVAGAFALLVLGAVWRRLGLRIVVERPRRRGHSA
jgi:hypothetical protein